MTPNRIAIALSVLLLTATGIVVLQGTPPAAVAPPRPIPTESPAPDTPWQRADLAPLEGLEQAILTAGDGPIARQGQLVDVSATWWVESIGREVQSVDHDRFLLGTSQPIEALGRVLGTMRPGETRQVRVPPELAYGQTGKLPTVPRGATLLLEVTLHSAVDARAPLPAPPARSPDQREGDLAYTVVAPGSGDTPPPGEPVHIHLTTWVDGRLVGSTLSTGEPLTIQPGTDELLPGIGPMLGAMRVGERRLVFPDAPGAGEEPSEEQAGRRVIEIERVTSGT